MVDTFNAHRGDCEAFEGRKKDTTQGIADGDAVARFQRTEFESAAEIVSFEHNHLVRFLE